MVRCVLRPSWPLGDQVEVFSLSLSAVVAVVVAAVVSLPLATAEVFLPRLVSLRLLLLLSSDGLQWKSQTEGQQSL